MGRISGAYRTALEKLFGNLIPRISKNSDIVVGRRGCYLLDDTSSYTADTRNTIIIREDATIIAALEVNGVDVLSDFNLSAKSLLKGETISARERAFTTIQLSAGSAMLY